MSRLLANENPDALQAPGLEVLSKNLPEQNSPLCRDARLLQREALQELGVALAGRGFLAARAAYVAPAVEVLGIFRGARKTLLAALDEAKTLLDLESEGAS